MDDACQDCAAPEEDEYPKSLDVGPIRMQQWRNTHGYNYWKRFLRRTPSPPVVKEHLSIEAQEIPHKEEMFWTFYYRAYSMGFVSIERETLECTREEMAKRLQEDPRLQWFEPHQPPEPLGTLSLKPLCLPGEVVPVKHVKVLSLGSLQIPFNVSYVDQGLYVAWGIRTPGGLHAFVATMVNDEHLRVELFWGHPEEICGEVLEVVDYELKIDTPSMKVAEEFIRNHPHPFVQEFARAIDLA